MVNLWLIIGITIYSTLNFPSFPSDQWQMLPIYARHLHRYHLDQSLYWLKALNQIRNTWKHKQILRAWRLLWKRQFQSRREDCSLEWSHPESSPLLQKAPNHVTERCFCWFCQAVLYCFRFWIQCAKLRKSMQKTTSDSEPSVPNRFKAMPSWTAGSPMKTGVKQIAPTMMKARNCGLANPCTPSRTPNIHSVNDSFCSSSSVRHFHRVQLSGRPFEVPCTMKRDQWRKSMSLSLCCTLKY